MSALTVDKLGKAYPRFASRRARLAELLTGRAHHTPSWALRDVSMRIPRGECVGIIGDNGAGKSTLLKLIAGNLRPTEGSCSANGRVTAILELGAGLHPEFSGRENIRFYAAALGYKPDEIQALTPAVIDFSELAEAIDRPVKTYSSGMTVRLAFSIVTEVEPDVLIVDEALAVGDQHFQKKCIRRIDQYRANGCTILLCSHSHYHIRQLCQRTLWLDQGRTAGFGATEEVVAQYLEHVAAKAGEIDTDAQTTMPKKARKAGAKSHPCELSSVEITPLGDGDPPLLNGNDLSIKIKAHSATGEVPNVGILIETEAGVGVTGVGTHVDGTTMHAAEPGYFQATLVMPDLALLSGTYTISSYLFDETGLLVYDAWRNHQRFRVRSEQSIAGTMGLVSLPREWR